ASGAGVPGQTPIVAGWPVAFSADGRKLAAHDPRGNVCEPASGGTACRPGAGVLRLVDLPGWREAAVAALPAAGWVGPVVFSPDASRVALVENDRERSTLVVVDSASGAVLGERPLAPGFRPSLLAYRDDGAALVLYGQPLGDDPGMTRPGPPRVVLVDAATLELRWEQPLPELLAGDWCHESCQASHERRLFASWAPAVVPARDGRALYAVHADADRLTTVDLQARAVRTVEIRTERPWLERLLGLVVQVAEAKGGAEGARKAAVLSADGARLYVTGSAIHSEPDPGEVWRVTQTALGVQAVELPGGRRAGAAPVEGSGAALIAAAPSGAYLLLRGWEPGDVWTEVLEARGLGRVARLVGWEVVVGRRLDGQPVVQASRTGQQESQLAVLDPGSFEVVRSWSVAANASWLGSP
ncbi:MAG TPA: hypothetical protein VG370_33120, partial [Chloroflexota bacterium]|nr:hypothetical protein [Chloroflexota bacterium]